VYHVQKAGDIVLAEAEGPPGRFKGLRRAPLVGRQVGAVHTGLALASIDPGGWVGMHLHSTEQSVYVLRGHPLLTFDGRTYRLAPDECALIPVGVLHGYRADDEVLLLEANAPAPRTGAPPDTFFTGEPVPEGEGGGVDIRDPRSRHFFRLQPGDMELDNLRVGIKADAPTVSAGMNTALLAYSGVKVKMLVDQRLGAVLHTMFMVDYEPGGGALPHDHPLEESYYIVEGEVEASADDNTFTLGPGDVFWTGVGCIHSFANKSDGRVRWIETQSPQPPANHSYRWNRDWDYLAERLEG
jgi:quercetin dioxygenase-like cupin family protein